MNNLMSTKVSDRFSSGGSVGSNRSKCFLSDKPIEPIEPLKPFKQLILHRTPSATQNNFPPNQQLYPRNLHQEYWYVLILRKFCFYPYVE